MDISGRYEELIALLGSQLPAPVEQEPADDGSIIFTGGAPPEVVVHLTDSSVRVSEFACAWETPEHFVVKPRLVGVVKWRRLSETAVMNAVSTLIKGRRRPGKCVSRDTAPAVPAARRTRPSACSTARASGAVNSRATSCTDEVGTLRASPSVAAVDDEPAPAETFREKDLHLHGPRVRHRVEMLVQPRDEALAESPDDARRLDALLVVLEPLLGRSGRSCPRSKRLCRRPWGRGDTRRRPSGGQQGA